MTTKKITLSSFKSFIKKNESNLFINVKSSLDGMVDCCMPCDGGFTQATKDKTESKDSSYYDATLGINGIWLVRGSRDYFTEYKDGNFIGIKVSNSCGAFIVATKTAA